MTDRETHWDRVYDTRAENALSWYEQGRGLSDDLIARHGDPAGGVLVVGAGLSRLPDRLLASGFDDVTVLDVSPEAVARITERTDGRARGIVADLTDWQPGRVWSVWQDRAVFHFLTDQQDRRAYLSAMQAAVAPGGVAVIGTFAEDGPEKCSGLPVRRYAPGELVAEVSGVCGDIFVAIDTQRERHVTPGGSQQPFTFVVFRRVA